MIRRTMALAIAATLALAACPAAKAEDPGAWFDKHEGEFLDLYRHLHAHPELSYHEVATASRIAAELKKAGSEVTTGVGKLGVVGVLKNGRGPTVLVRTDLDALPVTEATGLPFASKATAPDDSGVPTGVMHACGHDVHMTNLVATARWLAENKPRWSGTIVFIGQPAEEKIGGAKEMLADGLYTRFPKPDFALALHVAHDLEAGKLAYTSGPAMAGSTSVDVLVKGRGGHGAMPQNTVDPIALAALLVLDLQTIVSREVNPLQPAVVTVGSIHGGTKHNIIPNDVRLQLTLRSFRPEVGDQLVEGIRRRAKGLAEAHKAPAPVVTLGESTPPTVNTPGLVARVVPILAKELGTSNLVEVEPTMGAEDFGLYGQGGVPTFMFRLGTIPADRVASARAGGEALPSLHSALYRPDAPPEPPDRRPRHDGRRGRPPARRPGERRAMIDDRYPIHNPDELLSPSLLIFAEDVRRNLDTMIAMAGGARSPQAARQDPQDAGDRPPGPVQGHPQAQGRDHRRGRDGGRLGRDGRPGQLPDRGAEPRPVRQAGPGLPLDHLPRDRRPPRIGQGALGRPGPGRSRDPGAGGPRDRHGPDGDRPRRPRGGPLRPRRRPPAPRARRPARLRRPDPRQGPRRPPADRPAGD